MQEPIGTLFAALGRMLGRAALAFLASAAVVAFIVLENAR